MGLKMYSKHFCTSGSSFISDEFSKIFEFLSFEHVQTVRNKDQIFGNPKTMKGEWSSLDQIGEPLPKLRDD